MMTVNILCLHFYLIYSYWEEKEHLDTTCLSHPHFLGCDFLEPTGCASRDDHCHPQKRFLSLRAILTTDAVGAWPGLSLKQLRGLGN
jgi:hypothetical protein